MWGSAYIYLARKKLLAILCVMANFFGKLEERELRSKFGWLVRIGRIIVQIVLSVGFVIYIGPLRFLRMVIVSSQRESIDFVPKKGSWRYFLKVRGDDPFEVTPREFRNINSIGWIPKLDDSAKDIKRRKEWIFYCIDCLSIVDDGTQGPLEWTKAGNRERHYNFFISPQDRKKLKAIFKNNDYEEWRKLYANHQYSDVLLEKEVFEARVDAYNNLYKALWEVLENRMGRLPKGYDGTIFYCYGLGDDDSRCDIRFEMRGGFLNEPPVKQIDFHKLPYGINKKIRLQPLSDIGGGGGGV